MQQHALPPELPERPTLAANVQLLGEMSETGFQEQQFLVRRGDTFFQISELLYRVAEQINGHRTTEEIAAAVTASSRWQVTAEHVERVIQVKLAPLGIIATDDAPSVDGRAASVEPGALLGIRARVKILSPRLIDPLTGVLQLLYAPPVLIPMLLVIAIAQGWLYFVHGIGRSIVDLIYTPVLLLPVLGFLLLAAGFHEFGHAAALRYGGGRVRGIGIGFYLISPVFYTDITDGYRLGRRERVRTDLGGFYFNLIFALGVIAFYVLWRQEFLLIVVLLIDLQILQQLLPFVRFDGYWAFADLVGLPDPLSQIAPFLRGLLPGSGNASARLPPLKPWVKAAFSIYIALTVPVLGILLFLMVKSVPFIVSTAVVSLVRQLQLLSYARTAGDTAGVVLAVLQIVFLVLPLAGIIYILYSTGRKWLGALWGWAWASSRRRLVAGALNAALIALILFFWVPQLGPSASTLNRARVLLIAAPDRPIDGIQCNAMEQAIFHVHAHLTILDAGKNVLIPAGVGIKPEQGCLYWLHTHDPSGIIHVEAPVKRRLTLGNFFDIWGKSLSRTQVATAHVQAHQTMRVDVDGKRYSGNPRTIPLHAHTTITIEIGPPFEPPQPYDFHGL